MIRRFASSATVVALATLAAALLLTACSSPNRGFWAGTFDGSVSGTVEFTINARGTKVRGKMEGATDTGEPFTATFAGTLNRDFLKADFEGRAGTGYGLPVPFTGQMTGSLDLGRGEGDWSCQLMRTATQLSGTWSVEQQPQP